MKITNDQENEAALKVISLLMGGDPTPESNEGIALKTIVEAVQKYEKKYDLS